MKSYSELNAQVEAALKIDNSSSPTLSRKLINQRPASRKGWGTLGSSRGEKSQGRLGHPPPSGIL